MAAAPSRIQVLINAVGASAAANAIRQVGVSAASAGRSTGSVARTSTTQMNNLARAAGSVVRNLGGAAPAARALGQATGTITGGMRTAALSAAALALAVYGIGAALNDLDKDYRAFAGTVQGLRSLNNEIQSAAGAPKFAASTTGPGLVDLNGGNARQTAQDLEFLSRTADTTGNAVLDLAKDYLQLKASAQGSGAAFTELQATFAGFANAGVVLGLTTEQISNANRALGQMASKGKVTSEELKGQMAEAIPGVIGVAARAYGVSVAQLLKMVEAGQVEFAEFNRRLGAQLQAEYGTAAAALFNTTRIAMQRVKNEITDAKVLIGSGGLDVGLGKLLNSLNSVSKAMKANGAYDRFGASLGKSLDRASAAIDRFVAGGGTLEPVLRFVGKAFDLFITAAIATGDGIAYLTERYAYAKDIFAAGNVFSDSPFANFLASILNLADGVGNVLDKLFNGSFERGASLIERGVNQAAYAVNQFADALTFLSTGRINPGMTEDGARIAGILNKGVGFANGLLEAMGKLVAISGNLAGYLPGIADGFATGMRIGATALNLILTALEKVSALIGFLGLDVVAGQLTGLLFSFGVMASIVGFIGSRIHFVLAPLGTIKSLASAAATRFGAMATALGISNLQLALMAVTALTVAAALYEIFHRFDQIKSAIGGGSDILASKSAELGAKYGLTEEIRAKNAAEVKTLSQSETANAAKFFQQREANDKTDLLTSTVGKLKDGIASLLDGGSTDLSKIDTGAADSVDTMYDWMKGGGIAGAFADGARHAEKDRVRSEIKGFLDANGTGASSLAQLDKFVRDTFRDGPATGKDAIAGLQRQLDAGVARNPLGAGQAAIANGPAKPANENEFGTPIAIYLNDGTRIDLRGRASDAATFEQLAARTAANRPSQASAWAG